MNNAVLKTVTRAPTVKPAAASRLVQRKAVTVRSSLRIQTSLKVSSPADSAEKEAVTTAKEVLRLAIPESSVACVRAKDPITGEAVPQDAEAFVSAFLTFIGETETLERIRTAKAIPRIIAWFKGVMSELKGFVNEIPGLFVQAFKSLQILDIILVPRALAKVIGVFGSFAVRFISWGGQKVWTLLEIIFDVVSPGALGYIKKTGAALKSILKNPLPFVGNLVKAAKLGFTNFAGNFLTHLKNGLLEWLTGSLTGVYIPQALSLSEIGKFALSVLGITWAQIT